MLEAIAGSIRPSRAPHYPYFETHGSGRPLILLHRGLGSGEMFGPVLSTLAGRHQVVIVDLQGHGRTADIDRPLDVRLMADDIAAFIDHLGLAKLDLVGYSLGGGLALHTAAKQGANVGRPDGGHALAIPPGLTYCDVFGSPLFAAITLDFLDQQPS